MAANGLLDFLQTPEGTGLLSAVAGGMAGARRGTPWNNAGRAGISGLTGYATAQEDILKKQQLDEAQKMQTLQRQQIERQVSQQENQAKFFSPENMGKFTKQAAPEQTSFANGPIFSQEAFGMKPDFTSKTTPATPGGFDLNAYTQAMLGSGDPTIAQKGVEMSSKKAPKFSTAPQYDQQGRAFILAEDGSMKYLEGVKARDKLNEVRLGDKVGFRTDYSPDLQGSLPIGQSPDSVMSNQVTMRGQNMTDTRARDLNAITQQGNGIKLDEKAEARNLAKAGQVASFDVMLGSLDRLGKHPGLARSVGVIGAFPTIPGSESANFKAELDTFQSQAFLPMVSQLKGLGALSDAEGKKLTAAVGALNPAMGEKAFRDSIDRITSDMMAARERLTGEKRTSGASGGFGAPKPAAQTFDAKPPAQQFKGKFVTSPEGKRYQSDGMVWKEVK